MTADQLAEIREAARVALLTPGEAHQEYILEERQEAIKAAPTMLKATLDHITELEAEKRLALTRCQDWYAIANDLRRRNEGLLHRALSADHLRPQNTLLRELYLRERRRRQSLRILLDMIDWSG